MGTMDNLALQMHQITKRFPGVLALDDVSFACRRGEVHALVGENGAGKSTLVKILAGALQPDLGEIILNGERVLLRDPHAAQARGVSIIYQDFDLVPQLNVIENIFLGRELHKSWGLLDWSRMRIEAQSLLEQLGVSLDLEARVGRLAVAQQQLVEIAKTLSRETAIIAMDEPSAVLAGNELDRLFEIIGALKDRGITIIYISHRLDEVFQIADRVTVLKDGRFIETANVADVGKPQLIRWMVGRTLDETFPTPVNGSQDVVLEVRGLSRRGVLHDISFQLRRGEILALAGMVGSGRTALARALFGADPIDGGEVVLDGQKIRPSRPQQAIQAGIAFAPEDRKAQALIMGMSLQHNVTLPVLDSLQRLGLVNESREREIVENAIHDLDIKTPSLSQEVRYLSGGNQQKVVLAKWLTTRPQIMILDEPTHGVDVGAKAEVYAIMRELATAGTAILMISSELPEIIGMSERILVMRNGRMVGELTRAEASEEAIIALAT